ncbi:AAA-like domain protein [Symmachiella macrocystis]|uniref:AAA-like domain protein n=1 Tax=Symmachiella macrocystis TaxID=2527985 RepID=A0A5C6BP90_9PLAN|nr:ATP-binding protein [Symmachiella macrocystis]TWU14010.1 AAA-like domain protein [Symmachiella macrocystis]
MQNFEKLGAFYLGKLFDMTRAALRDELLLYDSKDLTTHAVCVGMTGSGKTGLCLSLLEEAAIDGIPAIAIDPKGDLGNLLLTFPDLAPDDFRPWIEESAATRAGLTPDEYAAKTADQWRNGLAQWGQTPERIAKFRQAVDIGIYTPGSNAGLPLTILRSFDAPPQQLIDDSDALRERISSATSGLLALLGIDADPIRSREHILLSNIFEQAWRDGRNLDVASLIRGVQNPPFKTVGVVDLETFFPAKSRNELAMNLNNLLASPSFASWMEGEPLNIRNLLYTAEGKPRLSIISIAHLSDAERMFFVTILLNEVLAWVRTQPGTSSLRALLYMDEVFGYFPPTANPPSKTPMLTLLKQARAYGLGVVLATQNPVDLDYKGLSNTGTWFLGRLQTERDKARVLEGLEGASAQAGTGFDRQKMEATLAGLGSRVFLMNNVHDDEPVVFQTRWALSYLRGPLTRGQIETLMADKKQLAAEDAAASPELANTQPTTDVAEKRPHLPAKVDELFLVRTHAVPRDSRLTYRPALFCKARLHFVKSTYKVDQWQDLTLLSTLGEEMPSDVWEAATAIDAAQMETESEPEIDADFATVPADCLQAKSYPTWQKKLKEHLYQSQELSVWKCAALKTYSAAGEAEGDFRIRLAQTAREHRDLQVEKIRDRFTTKLQRLQGKIQTAEERVAREKSQATRATTDSVISIGSTILGALFGRKIASRTNVGRASTSMRSAGRAAQQRSDVARAEEKVENLNEQVEDLQRQFEEDADQLEEAFQVDALELEELSMRPRKSDIDVDEVALLWTPWRVDADGTAEPVFRLDVKS